MDYLGCLRTFVRVAETGSFAGVAEEIGVTPAMVGRQVRWLETRLGVQLIARSTRRQSLTEAGRLFLDRASIVLGELQAAEESVARMRAVPRGRLTIDAPVTFGVEALAPLLPEFLSHYPEVQVDLTLTNRVVDLIEEGYDAVIRAGSLPDSNLMARRLADYELVMCAAPAYLETHAEPRTPHDLATHVCLGFHPGTLHDTWTLVGPDDESVTVRVSGAFGSNSGHALRHAALAGAGIILQGAALVADDLRVGRLVRVLPGYGPPPLPMHVLYAATRAVPPKLRAFLDFATAKFGRRDVA